MENIINSLSKLISPDIVNHASKGLGESNTGITKALGSAFPSILGGLLNKSSDSSFMGNILNMSKDQADEEPINSTRLATEGEQEGSLLNKGKQLLSSLFGNKTNEVAGSIGQSSGVTSTSALSLLTLAGPMVLGFLGKKAKTDGMNAGGLTNFLGQQKDNILSALPAGVKNIIGVDKSEGKRLERSEREREVVHREPVERERVEEHHHEGSGWKKWVFGLLGILLLFFVGRGFAKHIKHKREVKKHNEMVMQRNEAASFDTAALVTSNPANATFGMVKLPNGVTVNIPQNSEESKFLAFVKDRSKSANSNSKFTFSQITFDKNNTKVDQASQEQLKNVAAIMKAYPAVAVKVVGYTDADGSNATNMKISKQRATMVKTELVKLGANTNSITPEGAGEAQSASKGSSEQDRKVDFIVLKK